MSDRCLLKAGAPVGLGVDGDVTDDLSEIIARIRALAHGLFARRAAHLASTRALAQWKDAP